MSRIAVVMTLRPKDRIGWRKAVTDRLLAHGQPDLLFLQADPDSSKKQTAEKIVRHCAQEKAEIVVFSDQEKALAAYTASLAGVACLSNVFALQADSAAPYIQCSKIVFNGHMNARIRIPKKNDSIAAVATVDLQGAFAEAKQQEVMILCGNAFQNREQIALAREAAECLQAELCGSRAVVSAGLLPSEKMIGISGRCASPEVCVILGASGSQAMMTGIEDSGKIISVNIDPQAIIFDKSDLSVCCDCFSWLEKLKEVM